ncbi:MULTISPECIES: right-handed parallel beta-helix repeat-containing protein [Methylorubrum]|uniref:right-handed parallel beta-helix repeat-containing protein n=1 Tax=Methylorubrum TaxID=2282523 RepID=UPI0020A14046|nr:MULTISPECIES: right-handed parallel beta-helix repeat-containing protein [Methylorubrum]MCP1550550.1 parallel beta-helix repeat protein [Methylorubrum zatmanii]MCP1552837.1 parallel beta-helix repeat protein [Methylorubrum extorquens]MCP1580853.1 parallel beta-helix repeat protein [Methylorubrum extorquens]
MAATTTIQALSRESRLAELFLAALGIAFAGYMIFGKSFAYLGLPPLYAGELLFLLGLLAVLRARSGINLAAGLATAPALCLAALMGWVLLRTLTGLREYRVDALRDGAVALYGGYAFVLIALLLDDPRRLGTLLRMFRWLARIVIPLAIIAFILGDVPFFAARAGELSAHLAGACVLALVGLVRVGPGWVAFVGLGAVLAAAQNRGSMLAIAVPVCLALLAVGQWKRMAATLILGAGLLGAAAALDVEVELPNSDRPVSAAAVVNNIVSIVAPSSGGNLDDTKQWRLRWWNTILGYTVNGPYFWTGKGFGPNLAETDGYVVGLENGGPTLRSPHSIHMTYLARGGVPGLALWLLTCAVWMAAMIAAFWRARRMGERRWEGFFLFIACYVASIIIDASFDVALEGPMLAIPFWTLIGIGIGAAMIFRAEAAALPPDTPFRPGRARGMSLATLAALALLAPWPPAPARAEETRRTLSDPSGPCLVLRDVSDRTIEGLDLGPCGGEGVRIERSRNVTIRNLTIRDTGNVGIYIEGSEGVIIEENRIENTLSGIRALSSTGVEVRCNSVRNVRGPIPAGQFVQFDKVTGPGNGISCNIGENEPGRGVPEDAISLFQSRGEAGRPILVSRNRLVGGGPSQSGGGIMLGDGGGAYLEARDNLLIDPGQYGIAVASGSHMTIAGNVVIARPQLFTNVGISVWNQYAEPCHTVTVSGNSVDWRARTGRPNPWWDAKNCAGTLWTLNRTLPLDPQRETAAQPACACRTAGRTAESPALPKTPKEAVR